MTQKGTAILTTVCEAMGRCMTRKLNDSVNDNAYPNPNKAIQENEIELDELSATVSTLVLRSWFSTYPRSQYINYHNGQRM
jgi:hypothetical protein